MLAIASSPYVSVNGRTASTCIFPWVMVPVLSRQSISTRAKVSTEYISCTKTFFKPSLITAVKSEVMVKRAIPLGNIPKRAVDEFTTDDLRGRPFKSKASSKRARPKGMIIFPVKPANLSSDFMIRELMGLTVLASSMSLAA
ncbi:Uncharacterised protein [Streptococcus pneumoniae]|nr:Uncharacterised protein [Streptococcus pneumoniae]CJG52528.1 Uncharacterised protein [Streptococcus pneumoniae]CZE20930.1 Uncharacterised protein [Streptococcus pneumoniae]